MAYLEGLTSRGVADAAGAVRDLLLATAMPESDAEALAHASASMPRTMRAAVLVGIAWALPRRGLSIGSYARALAVDGAVLGEMFHAGLEERLLDGPMLGADVDARAAYEYALRAAPIHARTAAAIAANKAEAEKRKAEIQRAADDARNAAEAAIAAATARLASSVGRAALESTAIAWAHTDDAEHPYGAQFDGHALLIRLNDFPAEPLYTLLIDGVATQDLDDWPATWGALPSPPQWMLDQL